MDQSPLEDLLSSLSEALEVSPLSVPLLREWDRVWRLLVAADSCAGVALLD